MRNFVGVKNEINIDELISKSKEGAIREYINKAEAHLESIYEHVLQISGTVRRYKNIRKISFRKKYSKESFLISINGVDKFFHPPSLTHNDRLIKNTRKHMSIQTDAQKFLQAKINGETVGSDLRGHPRKRKGDNLKKGIT